MDSHVLQYWQPNLTFV